MATRAALLDVRDDQQVGRQLTPAQRTGADRSVPKERTAQESLLNAGTAPDLLVELVGLVQSPLADDN